MPQYPIRIDLEAARRATAARDAAKAAAKARSTPAAKAILDPGQAVARGNRMQAEEAKESKLIQRSGTGYGSFRNR